MWKNPAAAKEHHLPAPRDLHLSFQQTTFGPGSELSPEQYRQRIAQLELALASVAEQHLVQRDIIHAKEHILQALQAVVDRLESNIQADHFQDIDEAGMRGPPDEHLHSQQWKSVTPFSLSTPVLPSRPSFTAPDAPRPQQPIGQQIDTASEIDMIKQQLIKIQELQHLFLTTQAQQPSTPKQHDVTATLILVMTEEIKHSRISKDIKFKSYKDITDEVPLSSCCRTGNALLPNFTCNLA